MIWSQLVNSQLTKMFGRRREELIKTPPIDSVHFAGASVLWSIS